MSTPTNPVVWKLRKCVKNHLKILYPTSKKNTLKRGPPAKSDPENTQLLFETSLLLQPLIFINITLWYPGPKCWELLQGQNHIKRLQKDKENISRMCSVLGHSLLKVETGIWDSVKQKKRTPLEITHPIIPWAISWPHCEDSAVPILATSVTSDPTKPE